MELTANRRSTGSRRRGDVEACFPHRILTAFIVIVSSSSAEDLMPFRGTRCSLIYSSQPCRLLRAHLFAANISNADGRVREGGEAPACFWMSSSHDGQSADTPMLIAVCTNEHEATTERNRER